MGTPGTQESALRQTLATALVECADKACHREVRRFVSGLSSDEMQFIAEFLGSCILESCRRNGCSRAQLADRVAEFHGSRGGAKRGASDQAHKTILLLEYLCRSSARPFAWNNRAAGAAAS